jgi:hypothetical protein
MTYEIDQNIRSLLSSSTFHQGLSDFFQEAYVELLNTDRLFEEMYADDPEGNKLNEIPGVDEMVKIYPLS